MSVRAEDTPNNSGPFLKNHGDIRAAASLGFTLLILLLGERLADIRQPRIRVHPGTTGS